MYLHTLSLHDALPIYSNVVLMCLIFLLAGAFAMVSKAIGAVDDVVALGLGTLPPALILPGLFLVAGFVSLSIGTSMGTIAAVVPLALGVAAAAGLDRAHVGGGVIGCQTGRATCRERG